MDMLNLRQPLTRGEKMDFDIFNQFLVQNGRSTYGRINGLRPDFLLLNPDVGIAVFEVKDWDLSAMRYGIDICLGCAHAQPKKNVCRSFGECWPAMSAAWRLREVTANLSDRSRPARWRL